MLSKIPAMPVRQLFRDDLSIAAKPGLPPGPPPLDTDGRTRCMAIPNLRKTLRAEGD